MKVIRVELLAHEYEKGIFYVRGWLWGRERDSLGEYGTRGGRLKVPQWTVLQQRLRPAIELVPMCCPGAAEKLRAIKEVEI
jgi:hypothetical protein